MTVKDAADFLRWLRQATPGQESPWAIGTVQGTTPAVTVQFDGDVDSSGAAVTLPIGIPYLDSYLPTIGDRIVLLKMGKTWCVLGSINNDLALPNSLITAQQSAGGAIASSTWVEIAGFNTLGLGGSAADGQLSISGGKILIPATGVYEFIFSINWPTAAAAYSRTLVGVGPTGLGVTGPVDPSRNDDIVGAVTTTHIQSSTPWPQQYSKGDLVSAYAWQGSSGTVTVAAGGLWITGKRVG